jgi:thiol-disulfide isomerase/thioredoxin
MRSFLLQSKSYSPDLPICNRLIIAAACLLAALLHPGAQAAGQLEPYPEAVTAPSFSLQDTRGSLHESDDYRGRVVLVNFWASWCPPCIQEMPGLMRLKQKLAGLPFEVLAVNVGERKYKVWKFAKLVSFDLPILLDIDKATFRSWDVKVLPTSFLIDADGLVRYRVQGDLEWDSNEIVELLRSLTNERKNTQ